ncbi:MAG TPA: TadE/TadG family type IV pilus assembly protein, partial [Actinomycetota bacterium]|nr:TadE/TadG family type IV pilus assembly protein [Actinomycetota bacterium]
MPTLRQSEEGTAAMELGIILPLLLVLAALVAPLVKFGYDYMEVQRAASHGVRYATRADVNARPDGLGRRPREADVRQFVSDSSGGKVSAAAVSVVPDPSR